MISDGCLNAMRDAAQSREDGIVLVNSSGAKVATMADTSDSVTWDTATVGKLILNGDMTYSIEAGEEVAGWRAVLTDGSLDFGADFTNAEGYTNAGQFVLEATDTYLDIAEQV